MLVSKQEGFPWVVLSYSCTPGGTIQTPGSGLHAATSPWCDLGHHAPCLWASWRRNKCTDSLSNSFCRNQGVCVCVEKPLQSNENQRLVLGNQRAYQGNHSRAGLSLKRITISCFLSESRQTLYQIPVSHQISVPGCSRHSLPPRWCRERSKPS